MITMQQLRVGMIAAGTGLVIALTMVEADTSPSVQGVSLAALAVPQPVGGNDDSTASTISSDGRLVLFLSSANNLVNGEVVSNALSSDDRAVVFQT